MSPMCCCFDCIPTALHERAPPASLGFLLTKSSGPATMKTACTEKADLLADQQTSLKVESTMEFIVYHIMTINEVIEGDSNTKVMGQQITELLDLLSIKQHICFLWFHLVKCVYPGSRQYVF